jgi:hypothetical protein
MPASEVLMKTSAENSQARRRGQDQHSEGHLEFAIEMAQSEDIQKFYLGIGDRAEGDSSTTWHPIRRDWMI